MLSLGLAGLLNLISIGCWSTAVAANQVPSQTTVPITTCPPIDLSTGLDSVGISASTEGACVILTITNSEGQVYARQAPPLGHLNAPLVGVAALNNSQGYWLVAADGGVFAFGSANFFGSAATANLKAPIVGIAATPDDGGYYLVAADGGVFTFGDAVFQGSMGGRRLNAPVVGIAVDPLTGGYRLTAADGGVFDFGSPFLGSEAGQKLNGPVVGIATDLTTGGYWFGASDGGVFAFGSPFYGSLAGISSEPIVAITSSPGENYWLVDQYGNITGCSAPTLEANGYTPPCFGPSGYVGDGSA
jgi:hypothetical protein